MTNRILFIMPPPVHSAAIVSKYIKDSKLINGTFDCRYINLSMASSINDIGKTRIRKLFKYISLLLRIGYEIKSFQPNLVYVTPNTKGRAFIKDFL